MDIVDIGVGDRVRLVHQFGAYRPPLPAGYCGVVVDVLHDPHHPQVVVRLDKLAIWLFDPYELAPATTGGE